MMNAFFFIIFSIALILLMLNLLIAVMSEAYESVKEDAEKVWAYAQLSSIVEQADDELHGWEMEEKSKEESGFTWFWMKIRATLNASFFYRRYFMPDAGCNLKTATRFVDKTHQLNHLLMV